MITSLVVGTIILGLSIWGAVVAGGYAEYHFKHWTGWTVLVTTLLPCAYAVGEFFRPIIIEVLK
jgi:hypothetical protein